MRGTTRQRIVRYRSGAARPTVDALAGEEPMEIRVDGDPVAVTMRTPGADFDLALGFCLTEGIVADPTEVAGLRYCLGRNDAGEQTYNVVDLQRRTPGPVDADLRRRVYTSSSCGICGTTTIAAVRKAAPPLADSGTVAADVLLSLPARLRDEQRIFAETGGLHAAGIFTADGASVVVREDVGRHNAVDKVIGWAAGQDRLPLTGHVLVVSGRIAFEIVQKALRAGLPTIVAVSAPTSLAVDLAVESGMTLAGFVRDGSMNVYAGDARIR